MRSCRLIGSVGGLLLALGALVEAEQSGGDAMRLPAAVVDALKARWSDAQILGFKREQEGRGTAWEVDLQNDQRSWKASFSGAGKLLETEEILEGSAVPDFVLQAVEKQWPGAAITQVERETIGDGKKAKVRYEVETTKGELTLDAKGKVVK